ncbi:MAG: hypothetical protein ACRDGM_15455 [bacterium]
MNIWGRLRAWYHRCRTCEVDGIEGSLLDQFPELKPVEPLKFGHLYQCSKCGQSWFLHEHKHSLNHIRNDYLPLVRHWNQKCLTVGDSVLSTLAGIGGVEDHEAYITVPCSVQDMSGQQHEKSIVLVSKQPPFRWPERQKVHWADEVAAVSASPFALPLDVRQASSEKREEAMGFAPVRVVDKKGTEYTLGRRSHFFDHNGIKGEEIRLSGRQKKWRDVVWPEEAQAFYFVDWFDGCEELLVPRRRA